MNKYQAKKYCKAYPVKRLSEYSGWALKQENARKEKKTDDGNEMEVPRKITPDDHLYLHHNYVVTDGIFIDENIVFDTVTPEWIDFCKQTLKFEVPVYEYSKENL